MAIHKIKIIAGRDSKYLAEKIAASFGTTLGQSEVLQFSDGEFQPCFNESIRGCTVFIIQSTFPPSDTQMELLMMVAAARRASANKVVAVKTNVLYDAITTPNIVSEVAFNKHWSVEASGYYNGWTFSSDKSFKHWMIQPEARYWIHERFNGHFFGVHAQYIDYDFAGLKLLYGMEKKNSYNGNAYGGGISYGYQLYVSPRWNVEFTVGFGYLHFEYDKYAFPRGDAPIGKFRNEYWGLTKAGISIVYIIK